MATLLQQKRAEGYCTHAGCWNDAAAYLCPEHQEEDRQRQRQQYWARTHAEAPPSVNSCATCGTDIPVRRRYCDSCRDKVRVESKLQAARKRVQNGKWAEYLRTYKKKKLDSGVCMFIGCKEEPVNDGFEAKPYCSAHEQQIKVELAQLKTQKKWQKLLQNWED
jgi:predicted nucleic acid-binding Zn ribbon protein